MPQSRVGTNIDNIDPQGSMFREYGVVDGIQCRYRTPDGCHSAPDQVYLLKRIEFSCTRVRNKRIKTPISDLPWQRLGQPFERLPCGRDFVSSLSQWQGDTEHVSSVTRVGESLRTRQRLRRTRHQTRDLIQAVLRPQSCYGGKCK